MSSQKASGSLPYTAAPYRLIIADILLWLRVTFVRPPGGIPSLLIPIGPFNSGELDELYPTTKNIRALFLQLVLSAIQLGFILWLVPAALGIVPPFVTGYTPVWVAIVISFTLANRWVSRLLLNGDGRREYRPRIQLTAEEKRKTAEEKWVFVNGVAAGEHWMQNNVDRLAMTFRRDILGVHNETRGILFDLVECMLERTLGWATPSTRIVYARLLEIVSNETYDRIVLILHSQGAIEGGLALDWLFATSSAEQLSRIEVYTFGAAANHFNNPVSTSSDETGIHYQVQDGDDDRLLRHIEHYANSGDYVSQFGILHYRPIPNKCFFKSKLADAQNRFAGRLFVKRGSGHQLNGNYLDDMFTLDEDRLRVLDSNPFMESRIDEILLQEADIVTPLDDDSPKANFTASNQNSLTAERRISFDRRIKNVSRLWTYRNGGVPSVDVSYPRNLK